MNRTAIARAGFITYLALYLGLLLPIHVWHSAECGSFGDYLEQGEDHGLAHEHHHAGFCPTCQLSGGFIDLPSVLMTDVDRAIVSRLVISDRHIDPEVTRHQPSPRAPPSII